MTEVSICAYPWDLIGDPAAGQRLAKTGADRVAIAAAYHSVRAATPLHPAHRLVDAKTAAFYVPVRPPAWSTRRLVPQAARNWESGGMHVAADPFGQAARTALAAGLRVDAWVVLLHSTVLGEANPDLCVRNAFGDVYTYALCPGNSEVIEYAATLVTEVAELAGSSGATGLMVEACGPLGVSHLGHHDKTVGAEWTATDEALLSLCFCAGCSAGMLEAGLDDGALAAVVRASVGGGTESVDKALGTDADVLRYFREGTTAELAARVLASAREAGIQRLGFHAQPDPWAVGPFASMAMTRPGRGLTGAVSAATFILPGHAALQMPPEEISTLASAAHAGALGAYVSALPPHNAAALEADWRQLRDRGFDELCIYHFGLLSSRRLSAVSHAVAALKHQASESTTTGPNSP
ncbi:hypothetical protein [Pseudarthrobacter sp. DSP2-3-2b1]|uniref:hypothetical protein n=1 Tax=Pseudarthrobacter sp. DSP2-3-2b1 TaxID=2804661 RepID=UPI003CF27312